MPKPLHLLLSLFLITSLLAAPKPPPPELGTITWLRDYPTAQALAKKSGKPLFLLFQEVPG